MRDLDNKVFSWTVMLLFLLLAMGPGLADAAGSKASINADQVLVIDGKKVFPIGFTTPPPPDGKTPQGKNAIQELADAGASILRTGGGWTDENLRRGPAYS